MWIVIHIITQLEVALSLMEMCSLPSVLLVCRTCSASVHLALELDVHSVLEVHISSLDIDVI